MIDVEKQYIGQVVDVYRNVTRNCFSVRCKGRVIGHSRWLIMSDCKFVVNQAGRNRVLREKRKNVHAFVRGTLDFSAPEFKVPLKFPELDSAVKACWRLEEIRYNPYESEHFLDEGKKAVYIARSTTFMFPRVYVNGKH